MRIVYTAALAALIAAGATAAYAQTTGTSPSTPTQTQPTTPKKKACKGRAEADCTAPDCQWIAPTTTSAGKSVKGYCRKQKAAAKTPS